jgi:Zn-dependent protease
MTDARSNELTAREHVALAPGDVSEPGGPAWEELYQQTCAILAQPGASNRPWRKATFLVVTMVLFSCAVLWQTGFSLLALSHWVFPLIGVLLLHEFGHYAAMRLFGYRDVRMFFIPFLGAAVSGEKHAAPAWQQAIVLLMGPLPGIVVGVLLSILNPAWLTAPAAFLLIVINGFNLLPIYPLDGGRLLNMLFLSRQPFWEALFLVVSGIGLALLGWLNGSWLLGVIAVFCLVRVPIQFQDRRQRISAQRELPELPAEFSALSDVHRRELFQAACVGETASYEPNECAERMQALHGEVTTKPPKAIHSLALLLFYVAGVVVVVWSLSEFSFWGEGHPGEWSKRRIEALLKAELKLRQINLSGVAPGIYTGTGQTPAGTKWTLKVEQLKEKMQLTWSAVSDMGEKKCGSQRTLNNGVILDETIR